jgi:hypothetical protein
MLFFNASTGRPIESEDMIRMYGTDKAIPALGIFDLTYQPDFVPFAFNPVNNGTYLPVKSERRFEIEQLMKAGYTEAEAEALLDGR